MPSDRQHRLLHGSSARSLRASVVRCTIHARFRFLSFSFVLAWLPWRPCRERKSQHRHATHGGKHGAAAKTRALVVCVVAARSFTCTAYTSDRAREQRCPLPSSRTANAWWSTRCVCLSPFFFSRTFSLFFYFTSFRFFSSFSSNRIHFAHVVVIVVVVVLLLSSSFSSICIHIFVFSFFLIYIFVCFFSLNDTLNRSLCRVIPPNHVSHKCERQRAR